MERVANSLYNTVLTEALKHNGCTSPGFPRANFKRVQNKDGCLLGYSAV
jgi:hypothetical protein